MTSIFWNYSMPLGGFKSGKDMAGIELSGSPQFLVGSTVDAGAKGKSPELEIEEMNKKIEAGVQFFISPPLFDLSAIHPFMKRVDIQKTKIIPNGFTPQITRHGPIYYA